MAKPVLETIMTIYRMSVIVCQGSRYIFEIYSTKLSCEMFDVKAKIKSRSINGIENNCSVAPGQAKLVEGIPRNLSITDNDIPSSSIHKIIPLFASKPAGKRIMIKIIDANKTNQTNFGIICFWSFLVLDMSYCP